MAASRPLPRPRDLRRRLGRAQSRAERLRLATGEIRGGSAACRQLQARTAPWLRQAEHVRMCWVPRQRNLAHHLARTAAGLPAGADCLTSLGQRSRLVALAS